MPRITPQRLQRQLPLTAGEEAKTRENKAKNLSKLINLILPRRDTKQFEAKNLVFRGLRNVQSLKLRLSF